MCDVSCPNPDCGAGNEHLYIVAGDELINGSHHGLVICPECYRPYALDLSLGHVQARQVTEAEHQALRLDPLYQQVQFCIAAQRSALS